jgi:DNA polymerase-1
LSGIHRTEKPGFEADDVIGTMATRYGSEFERILVLTGDKDMMQLARKNVFIVTPQKGLSTVAIYGPDAVQERFGIMPELIPDFKGLMGDPSDNYKGAPGIGPKTATKLLTQFKSVEHMIEHVNEIQPERIQSIIKENTESIVLSKKLATILTDMELGNSIEECQFNGFRPEMRAKLEELQLYSLIGRFYGGKNGATKKQVEKKEELEPSESDPQLDLFS